MTRILVLSDLHQEFTRDPLVASTQLFLPKPIADDIDVVVLAGDVDVPASRSLEWIANNFSGVPTIYVLGNHDYYQFQTAGKSPPTEMQTYLQVLENARVRAKELGIHLLENDTVEIAGTRFIGSTLWTDFRLTYDPPIFEKMRAAQGRKGMNDYRRIKRPSQRHPEQRRPMRPIDTINLHIDALNHIWAALREPFSGAKVVVSHHAPHPMSLPSQNFGSLDHCFASDLTATLLRPDAPDLWIHGHVHKSSDYVIGKTRIVANPMGYRFTQDGYAQGFDPALVVEV